MASSEVRFLLLGKTGSGKSATGNMIMDNEDAFESCGDSSSVTKRNKTMCRYIDGKKVIVVDTPGTIDTKTPDAALIEIAGAIVEFPSGYDAFVVILRYPVRLTPEEHEAIEQLDRLFGQEFYKFAVLVLTGGDTWRKQKKNRGKTFEEYLAEEQMSTSKDSLSYLVKRFSGGCVLFDNFEEDQSKREEQVGNLLRKVEYININQGKRYTNDYFNQAKRLRDENVPKVECIQQVSAEIGSSCFPFDSKVIKFPGIQVDIGTIVPGDLILGYNASGKPEYQEVYMLGHEEYNVHMKVVEISTATKSIRMSPGHYLPINDRSTYVLAQNVCIGDCINVLEENNQDSFEEVVSVSMGMANGKFNPFTVSGNLYVDGVLATCYEEHLRPEYAHRLMVIPRLIYRGNRRILDMLNHKKVNGVPWWAVKMMKLLE